MSSRTLLTAVAMLSMVFTATFMSESASAAEGVSQAACDRLTDVDFSGIDQAPAQIVSSRLVMPNDDIPQYCEIRGYVSRQVSFELELPISAWNGRFIEIGCGGSCGNLAWTFWCELHRGYACIVSDMGHEGRDEDGLWAADNLEAQIDFGYRGPHVVAVAGKAITAYFYKSAPKYSYFRGCSTGGRQALVEAQRFPWDFDGIIGGGPWIDDTFTTMTLVWESCVLKGKDGKPLFTKADIESIHAAVLRKCDLDDGVRDGLIGNPLGCKFSPEELKCKGVDQRGCLTDPKVEILSKVYSGPMTSSGAQLTPGGAVPGSELRWIGKPDDLGGDDEYVMSDGSTAHLEQWALEYFRWMVLPPAGRTWTLQDFNFDSDHKRFYTGMQESLLSSTNPDLRKFKAGGGKLMLYIGWNDEAIPRTTVDYYETAVRTMGGRRATEDFFRLFAIPGGDHCWGGDGPWAIDYLGYMEAWVERGEAPNKMIGAHVDTEYLESHSEVDGKRYGSRVGAMRLRFPLDSSVPVDFTRPVYPYPLWAKYQGQGDPNKASSYIPVGP